MLTAKEKIELASVFEFIEDERNKALQKMFTGTQLKPRSRLEDAKTLAKEAKEVKKKVDDIPGVGLPNLALPSISLNVDIFNGIDLRSLVNFRLPSLSLPGIDFNLIPDIKLGRLPGFDLPTVRLNLKGLIKFKDLLPDISLRALAFSLAMKWPDLNFPSLMIDLSKILNIDFDLTFPRLKLAYPEFFTIDLHFELPNIDVPDINLPSLPDISLPNIDIPSIDLPGINFPALIKIPGFDKVLRLLFELFDELDLNVILAELGVEFLADFLSSALPIIQQVKSGAQAASSWGKAAQDWYKASQVPKHRAQMAHRDAKSACDAIETLLRNSRDQNAILATIQTTQFAVSTAGLFADLGGATGPAVAAGAAVAKMCQKIMFMGARYKEMKKVNQILKTTPPEQLGDHLFEVSPLLGCYYIANSTHAMVIGFLNPELMVDFMTDTEKIRRNNLEPMIKSAQKFIRDSRYVLDPIYQTTGMYMKLGWVDRHKKALELYAKKKLGMAPQDARAPTHFFIG